MGNKMCCQPTNYQQETNEKIQFEDYQPQILPKLSQPVKEILYTKKPFEKLLKDEKEIVTKKYGEEFYQGPVDTLNRPSGYGKLYKKDGSLVVSHFNEGNLQGPSIFIFNDGSFYKGNLIDNKAEDENGHYQNSQFIYDGGFHNNAFNGKGKEKGKDQRYSFDGEYINGKKSKGLLIWTQGFEKYEYEGLFNENGQFQNKGVLKQGQIGTYKGNFKNGKKHGQGIYTYNKNDFKYEGQYRNGVKSGAGTIYNHDNTIAYSGNFQNDLPNGEGYIIQNGKKAFAKFKDGLDIQILQ